MVFCAAYLGGCWALKFVKALPSITFEARQNELFPKTHVIAQADSPLSEVAEVSQSIVPAKPSSENAVSEVTFPIAFTE